MAIFKKYNLIVIEIEEFKNIGYIFPKHDLPMFLLAR